MIPGIHIHDVNAADVVKEFLSGIGTEDIHHAWIRANAKNRHLPCLLEGLMHIPLQAIPLGVVSGAPELSRHLRNSCIDVMRALGDARSHNREVLVGERHVDDNISTCLFDQTRDLVLLVCIQRQGNDIASLAIASHFATDRLARATRSNSLRAAHLSVVTRPTPPAPIMSRLAISLFPGLSEMCNITQIAASVKLYRWSARWEPYPRPRRHERNALL